MVYLLKSPHAENIQKECDDMIGPDGTELKVVRCLTCGTVIAVEADYGEKEVECFVCESEFKVDIDESGVYYVAEESASYLFG